MVRDAAACGWDAANGGGAREDQPAVRRGRIGGGEGDGWTGQQEFEGGGGEAARTAASSRGGVVMLVVIRAIIILCDAYRHRLRLP